MARSYRPSWQRAASVAVLASSMQAGPTIPIVECVLDRDPETRVYRLVDRGSASQPRWWLTLRSRATGTRIVEMPLPGARVEQSPDRVTLSSMSGNGGLAVALDAAADQSSVDVFVNFELEVNVWRDLSPEVEHMNTHGPRADAQCRVLPAQASWP